MSADDVQTEILQRLTRVETKLDMQINAKDMAAEALQSAKSAHEKIDDMKSGQRWMIGTTISAVGLFLVAIGFMWKVATGS